MLLSGLERIDRKLLILADYLARLPKPDEPVQSGRPGHTPGRPPQGVAEEQWNDVAEHAALARGVWRGVEATVAPFINPVRLAAQSGPAFTVNSSDREALLTARIRHARNHVG
jgi:hypothetical protein